MEPYQVNFIIAALFIIAAAIFYTGEKEEIGLTWMLIGACFIGYAIYLGMSDLTGACYVS